MKEERYLINACVYALGEAIVTIESGVTDEFKNKFDVDEELDYYQTLKDDLEDYLDKIKAAA